MNNIEPKKLTTIRILQIFYKYSDSEHPLTQEDIAHYLKEDYGINIERKAISRNISFLQEAGFDIDKSRNGAWLHRRLFENSELRMLIDGVLSSRYIIAKHSKDLIEKLCSLSNRYFRSHINYVYSINDWNKSDNAALFLNIELIDEAIEEKKQITFDYNKYGIDKKLHKTSAHKVSPYQLILHNQQYYLMGLNERWRDMSYYRLDRITNMNLAEEPITPIRSIKGYENGIDYKALSATMPYMYNDAPEHIELIADEKIIDDIMDWFGRESVINKAGNGKVKVRLTASLLAMEHWAVQYINHVEVISPELLRTRIRETLENGLKKYKS